MSIKVPTFEDEFASDRDLLVVVSNRLPKTWVEGIAHVLSRRKLLLVGEVDYAASARILEITHQLDALKKIAAIGGSQMSVKGKKLLSGPEAGQSRDEHRMALARVLCPANWRAKFETPMEAAIEAARSLMLERKEVDANRAFIDESRRILRFLELGESDAKRASESLRRADLKRVS